jgi:hypothetical protein
MSKRKECFFNDAEDKPSTRARVAAEIEEQSDIAEQDDLPANTPAVLVSRANIKIEIGREAIFVSGVDDEHASRHQLRAAGGRWGLSGKWIFNRANSQPFLSLLNPPMAEVPTETTNAELLFENMSDDCDNTYTVVKCSSGKSVATGYCCNDGNIKCFRCKQPIMQGSLMMGINTSKAVIRWFDDDYGHTQKVDVTQ